MRNKEDDEESQELEQQEAEEDELFPSLPRMRVDKTNAVLARLGGRG